MRQLLSNLQRLAVYACLACALGLSSPTRADTFDDQLQTAWEAMWDERGYPRIVLRWEQRVIYRIYGTEKHRNTEHVVQALEDAAAAARLSLVDVSQDSDAETKAQLHIEIASPQEMSSSLPTCFVQVQEQRGGVLAKVHMKMPGSAVWHCAHHEAMHAMGIPGHPGGDTVLSYFGRRPDVLTDLDVLLLRGWYASPPGASPLEAMATTARYLAIQDELGLAPSETLPRVDAFLKKIYQNMAQFARGQGEVPNIIHRSGRMSEASVRNARAAMALYLGLAHMHGRLVGMPASTKLVGEWLQLSADNGFAGGQYVLGVWLKNHNPNAETRAKARQWLQAALAAGVSAAQKQLEELDKEAATATEQAPK
jgi:TPR repeat protein